MRNCAIGPGLRWEALLSVGICKQRESPGYFPMLLRRGESVVLLADSSTQRMEDLARKLEDQGFEAMCTHSPAECLEMAANYRPYIVVLDGGFLQVDQENIPEYIHRISSSTMIVVTVDDVSGWQGKEPNFVDAVYRRGDVESILALLRQVR